VRGPASLCALARPEIAVGHESPIEPWLASFEATTHLESRTAVAPVSSGDRQGTLTGLLPKGTTAVRGAERKKPGDLGELEPTPDGEAASCPRKILGPACCRRSLLLTCPFIEPSRIVVRNAPSTRESLVFGSVAGLVLGTTDQEGDKWGAHHPRSSQVVQSLTRLQGMLVRIRFRNVLIIDEVGYLLDEGVKSDVLGVLATVVITLRQSSPPSWADVSIEPS
jgi:hypothetical protein